MYSTCVLKILTSSGENKYFTTERSEGVRSCFHHQNHEIYKINVCSTKKRTPIFYCADRREYSNVHIIILIILGVFQTTTC